MQTSLVLTVLGLDRAGLVQALSETVSRFGANWEASRMARLGGRFAGMLLVRVDQDQADALTEALCALDATGLKVFVERSVDTPPAEEQKLLRLELLGTDHPGIIREISQALARWGVNLVELSSECLIAPMSGETMFKMTATLQSPRSVTIDQLSDVLEALAQDLMVDISLAKADQQ